MSNRRPSDQRARRQAGGVFGDLVGEFPGLEFRNESPISKRTGYLNDGALSVYEPRPVFKPIRNICADTEQHAKRRNAELIREIPVLEPRRQ